MNIISEKSKCCGCSACVAVCPKHCIIMENDIEGFSYPVINQADCVNCGLCEKTCPILNLSDETAIPQEAYVVQNRDEKVLAESTAGGAFTEIARYVLNSGGVVFGAAMDDSLKVQHKWVDNEDDLRLFRNSKYVQSFVGGVLSTMLNLS